MSIVKKLNMLILLGTTLSCYAEPPFQVLRMCIDNEPFEKQGGCEDQYDITIDGHLYGTIRCKDKFYMIIRDKKMDPEKAINHSMNPEINPGVEFTTSSLWYKINFANQDYLCIYAPLSEQGVGASHNQYYIVENAFDEQLDPKIYFYFLDKNIAPFFK